MDRSDVPPSNNQDVHPGKAALARVLGQLADEQVRVAAGEDAHASAERLWPNFKFAVGYAISELRGDEAKGVAEWRASRHR